MLFKILLLTKSYRNNDKTSVEKETTGQRWSSGYQRWRKYSFIAVHLYIVFHLLAWYVFEWSIWGKTAMVGVMSFLSGHINAAAIMVVCIYLSTLLYGRFFCGWLCHLRGLIEFSDWVMHKLGVKNYKIIRDKNVLLNTRYRWYFRVFTLLVLLIPIISFYAQGNFHLNLNPDPILPLSDLPGFAGKLFNERFPINMDIGWAVGDFFIALCFTMFILFSISFLMNYHFGQGAFCRILCPYAVPFVPLMNVSPWEKKITRVGDCKGCRKCSENCPQGIDVSREIHHFAGKVINRECIKCYRCIDSCVTDVLADTRKPAVAQVVERKVHKGYKLHPWQNGQRHLQIFQPLPIWVDVLSILMAFITGMIFSMLGGFWFYVGAIFGFVFTRKVYMVGRNTSTVSKCDLKDLPPRFSQLNREHLTEKSSTGYK